MYNKSFRGCLFSQSPGYDTYKANLQHKKPKDKHKKNPKTKLNKTKLTNPGVLVATYELRHPARKRTGLPESSRGGKRMKLKGKTFKINAAFGCGNKTSIINTLVVVSCTGNFHFRIIQTKF